MSARLNKWDVIRVWCPDLRRQHDKFCICVSAHHEWFFFINSKPPEFRRAREHAVSINNTEATFLSVMTSYVDTTSVEQFADDRVGDALAEPGRHCGPLVPFLRDRIKAALRSHGVLTEEEQAVILQD